MIKLKESFEKYDIKLSFIVLGNNSVGKTCFLKRFRDDLFFQNYSPTIGVDMIKKCISYHNKIIQLKIFDTAGQENYLSVTRNFYTKGDGCLLFFDTTEQKSFNTITTWLEDINKNIGSIPMILVGTKADLIDKKVISLDEALRFAKEKNLVYYESSAVTGYNVDDIVLALVKLCIQNKSSSGNLSENIDIQMSEINNPHTSQSCCTVF